MKRLSVIAATLTLISTFAVFQSINAATLFEQQYITGGNVSGLTYPGLDVAGGALRTNVSERVENSLGFTWDQTTAGTFYIALLMEVNDSQGNNAYNGFELNSTSEDSDRTFQYGQLEDGNYSIRTTAVGNAQQTAILSALNSDTNLIVLELNFSTLAAGDSVSAYLNPTNLSGTSGNIVSGSLSGFDFKDISLANLASFAGGAATYDEIRFGNSWTDVVSVIPEPGTYGLMAGFLAFLAIAMKRFRKR